MRIMYLSSDVCSSDLPAPAAMAVSSAEQIEQASDDVENRNKADDRHMEAPRFAPATPPPTSRGTEALERTSNLEARVEEPERARRRMMSLLIEWVELDDTNLASRRRRLDQGAG